MENDVTILAVEKKKTGYKISTSEGDYAVDEDTLLRHMLFKDKVFTAQEFKKILVDQEISLQFQKAIRYLKYGMRSEWEIKTYLGDIKGWATIKKRLASLGYINDRQCAKVLVDYYKRNHKGPALIELKCQEKKIAKALVEEVLAEYDEEEQLTIIQSIVEKERSLHQDQPLIKQKQLLQNKLIRDGFASSLVHHVLNQCDFVDQSDERLKKEFVKLQEKFAGRELSTREANQRILSVLLAKGYTYEQIRKMITTIEP